MTQLTRRQHYVPRFYLAQWAISADQIILHDLADDTVEARNPKSILISNYFYEEDPGAPDNRVENILGAIETAAAPIFKKIAAAEDADDKKYIANLVALTDDDLNILCEFLTYQYLRVPGSIDQKAYELQTSSMPKADQEYGLNPGRFVESGFSFIVNRFKKMKMLMFISREKPFFTCDWPCFDMKDSNDSPLLGVEIGARDDVVCWMPLSPRIGVVLFTETFTAEAAKVPRLVVNFQLDDFVNNQNTLVIQKAVRRVIAPAEDRSIFTIASSRKKGRPAKD